MNTSIRKFFLLLYLVLWGNLYGWGSECYHYHYQKSDTIINRDGKLYLQHTDKDPDGITYVSRNLTPVTGMDTQGFQQIADDETSFLVRNKTGYYLIKKERPYDNESTKALWLWNSKSVQKTSGATLIRIDGQWQFVKPRYDNTILIIRLPQLPKDFEILYNNSRSESAVFLIREYTAIGVLNITYSDGQRSYQYGHIPGLNAATTVFHEGNYYLDDFILMDNNTAYLINYDLNYTEHTSDFTNQGKKENFHLMQLHRNHGNEMIFEDSSQLWVHFKDGIDLQGGDRSYFYPVEGSFIGAGSDIIKTEDGNFTSGYNAVHNMDPININAVADIASLEYLNAGEYKDNVHRYTLPEGNILTIALDEIPVNAVYFPPINAYRAHTPAIHVDNRNIYLTNEATAKPVKVIPHQGPVQKITKAYLFDRKIMIEEKLMSNPSGTGDLVFLGALAEPVSPCDGGRGQHPVVVEYCYFFKDGKAVYTYHSGDEQLTTIPGINPDTLRADNYEDIQSLYRLLPKRKAE